MKKRVFWLRGIEIGLSFSFSRLFRVCISFGLSPNKAFFWEVYWSLQVVILDDESHTVVHLLHKYGFK